MLLRDHIPNLERTHDPSRFHIHLCQRSLPGKRIQIVLHPEPADAPLQLPDLGRLGLRRPPPLELVAAAPGSPLQHLRVYAQLFGGLPDEIVQSAHSNLHLSV